jgi:FkbM family methyltransferase
MKLFLKEIRYSLNFSKLYVKYILRKGLNLIKNRNIKIQIKNDTLLEDLTDQEKKDWEFRIQDVLKSEDNDKIVRVEDAGTIKNGNFVMHNGIQIIPTSYYGKPNLKLLIKNRGVHEPQEEFIFQETLKTLPENSVILELGSYWAFYSLWFYKEVKNAKCYMVEPDLASLKFGKRNFEINDAVGDFTFSYISNKSYIDKTGNRFVCVDDFVKNKKIEFIHILHCDIQGFEDKMLEGAIKSFELNKIEYVFISTHSNNLHAYCIEFLKNFNFNIIADVNMDESYSLDGLIVAKSSMFKQVENYSISKKQIKNRI